MVLSETLQKEVDQYSETQDYLEKVFIQILTDAISVTVSERGYATVKLQADTEEGQKFITDVIRNGYDIWKVFIKEVDKKYGNDPFSEIGFLVFIEMMSNPNGTPYDQEDSARKPFYHKAVETIVSEIGEDDTCYDDPFVDIIKRLDSIKDMKLVHTFFEMFQTIGKVHRDPSLYENESDIKLHYQLMTVYRRLMGR